MLRTTRRNRDSTSRKTLKQRGGAIWKDYDNHGKKPRIDRASVDADWTIALKKGIETNILPPSLELLGVSLKPADKTIADELNSLIDAHSYQDSLFILSTQLSIAKILYPDELATKIGTNLTLSDASQKYDIIKKGRTNDKANYYANDVFTFLNVETPSKDATNRITYLFDTDTIENEEMFLEPTILKNIFMHGLANLFISMKRDNKDIELITGLLNTTNTENYTSMVKFVGRFWRRYIEKESNKFTGHGLTGSFYINQEYRGTVYKSREEGGGPNYDDESWNGTFKKIVDKRGDDNLTFYSKLIDTLCKAESNKTPSGLNNNEYKNIKDRDTWVQFIVDLFLHYKNTTGEITRKSVMKFIVSSAPAAATAAVDRGFIPPECLDTPYADTGVTPNQLLAKLAPEYISFFLHLIVILRQNEKIIHDTQLPEAEKAEFVAKFGSPIAKMNDA